MKKTAFSFSIWVLILAVISQACLAAKAAPVSEPQTAYAPAVSAQDAMTSSAMNPAPDAQWQPWSSPLSAAGETTGRAFYVSASGGSNGDGSETNPWRSIQTAMDQLQAGDTLFIGEGTYRESVKFLHSGTADARITIQGIGEVIMDGTGMAHSTGLNTDGQDYWTINNVTLNHYSNAVRIEDGSQFIEIDGLRADGNITAVRIDNATDITLRNAYVINSNNAFRAVGASRRLLLEDIEAYNSRDIYDGMNPDYKNGDGFIFEATVADVVFRRIISANHWDAGFDIKASNVLIENALVYGSKNNFKMWGDNITIVNSMSRNAIREIRPNGSDVEGNGITIMGGSTRAVNVTFVDNEDHDIAIYTGGTLRLENSIVARSRPDGLLLENDGVFTSDRVLWFFKGYSQPDFQIGAADLWADPGFVNWGAGDFHLKESSLARDFAGADALPAADLDGAPRTVGPRADLGAYEYQGVPTPPFKGITTGETVQGTLFIEPNTALFPTIAEVTYYIDGNKHSRTTKRPYALGGSKGYNTSGLSQGAHMLKAVIKINKRESITVLIAFIVA